MELHEQGETQATIGEELGRHPGSVSMRLRLLGARRESGTQRRRWTPEEDAALLELSSAGETFAAIGERLGRSGGSVANRAKLLREGLKDPKGRRRWTPEDDAELLELARAGVPQVEIARRIGRRQGTVSTRLKALGFRTGAAPRKKRREWLPEDDTKLLELAERGVPQVRIAEELGRDPQTVSQRLISLRGRTRERAPWTEEQLALLEERYGAGDTYREIGEAIGRNAQGVADKVAQLKRAGRLPERGPVKRRRGIWDDALNQRLLGLLGEDGRLPVDAARELAAELGVPVNSVQQQASRLRKQGLAPKLEK